MGRLAIGRDEDVDHRPSGRRLGDHPARTEGFVVGMGGDDEHRRLSARPQQARQSVKSAPGPELLRRALRTMIEVDPHDRDVSTTALPSAARSRSAWCWRT